MIACVCKILKGYYRLAYIPKDDLIFRLPLTTVTFVHKTNRTIIQLHTNYHLSYFIVCVYLERCIPLTTFDACPLCGAKGSMSLVPHIGMKIFVNLKGFYH